MDRNRRSEHADRGPFDHLSSMAPVDFAHAPEEETGLRSIFQPPFPVSPSIDPAGVIADISGR